MSGASWADVPQYVRDRYAARWADDAARSFEWDEDCEDAESAAARAVDIFSACSREGAAQLVGAIFGSGESAESEPPRDGVTSHEEWREWRAHERARIGAPDIAAALVREHTSSCACIMQTLDAIGDTCGEAFAHGIEALGAARALRAHTYGGAPFDTNGALGAIVALESAAIDYCIGAIRDAAWNVRHERDDVSGYGADSRPWCDR